MKKKILSLICMTLTLCILLSSCGAGEALCPPFLKLLGNTISNFFDNAENLLKGNEPLILDGHINYRLDSDGICPEAETALLTAIQEKTGCDLASNTDETAPKLRIGLDLSSQITAADYFIGFSEGDLVITAASTVMLTEAVRYFTDTFVTSEHANCGASYLYVEGDLSYTGETIELIGEDGNALYSVAYAPTADKNTFSAVTQLIGNVKSTTGVNLSMQDNYFQSEASAETKEILIGLTTREESIEATNALDQFSYYIGIRNNKIIITAKNNYMLQKAVKRFNELFVTNEKAAASYEAHTLSLPASLSYTQSESVLSLCSSGASDYVLIYPAGASERLLTAVCNFRDILYRVTGALIPISSDAEHAESTENEKEILVGATNRLAGVLSGTDLEKDRWTASAVGERLVVNAGSVNSLCKALEALRFELISYAEQQNSSDEDNPNARFSTLYLPADFAIEGTETPHTPSR